MSAKSKSYAVQISNAQVMLAGIKANLGLLEKRGITDEFASSLEGLLNDSIAKNNEQEKLKADLKSATAALDVLLTQMLKSMSEATTVVKMEIPKEQWKEFGITAKR
jgi:hypothetical protein